MGVHRAGPDPVRADAPDVAEQLGLREHPPGVAREPGGQLELAAREPHRDLAHANLPRAVVDDERPGLDDLRLPEQAGVALCRPH